MTSPASLQTSLRPSHLSPAVQPDAFPAPDLRRVFLLSVFAGLAWLLIINLNTLGVWIGVILTGIMLVISLMMLGKGKIVESLAILVYLAMVQPAQRTYIVPLPYLTLEYFFIFWILMSLGKHKAQHLRAPAIFYLLYLLLEILGVLNAFNAENARSILMSSMTIGFALLLVSKLHFGKDDLSKLFMGIIIGAFSLVVIIGYGYGTSSIDWGRQSNVAASGGMGPVQISMLLAIGAIIFLLLADRVNSVQRLMFIVLAAGISLVMVLTFSRNGLYLTIIALVAYYFLFSRFSGRTIAMVIFLSILGIYLFGVATQVAGPAFTERYSSTDPTNRDLLVRYGWRIFLDNPLLGVGTSNYYRVVAQSEYLGSVSGAHNELIRAATEHGIFGLVFWLFFALSCVRLGFSQARGKTRALRMTLLMIFFAYLAVNGLKLLIQPLILLVALSTTEF